MENLKKTEVIEVLADIISDKAMEHEDIFLLHAEKNPDKAEAHKALMMVYSCIEYEMRRNGFVSDGSWLILCLLKKQFKEYLAIEESKIGWKNPFSEIGVQALYNKALERI